MVTATTRRQLAIRALCLALLVCAVFAVSVKGNFLWDDDSHVTANPCIIGPLGLREIWTTAAANYFPLVLTNFWIQHALWGLNPIGYHVVTITCHAGATVALWAVLRKLHVTAPGFCAAAWAVHPIQVESVAWICELKNTQSTLFFLLSIWFFLNWLSIDSSSARSATPVQPMVSTRARGWNYAFALLCGALAILSKPSTVVLPAVILLCWWWSRRPLGGRSILSLAPFVLLSAAASIWAIWEQKFHSGAIGASWNQSLLERLSIAFRAPWFYLTKLIWPDLCFIYPRWSNLASSLWLYAPLTVLVVAAVWLLRHCSKSRAITFAGLFFGACLLPILGFFSVYFFRFSFVSDHFQYLASIGAVTFAISTLIHIGGRHGSIAAVLLILALSAGSVRRCTIFRSDEALWANTVAVNSASTLALTRLGAIYSGRENDTRATSYFLRAVALDPDDFYARNGLGCQLLTIGRPQEAVSQLMRAVAINPTSATAQNNLGRALQNTGNFAEAMHHYERSLTLTANNPNAHNNLGTLLVEMERFDEAIVQFKIALQQQPSNPEIHHNFGNALRAANRLGEAVRQYETALRLHPRAETHDEIGIALHAQGNIADAIAHFEAALQLQPDFRPAREHLANARVALAAQLGQAGNPQEALRELDRALALQPELASAHLNRGVALMQLGNLSAARDEFAQTIVLDPASSAAHRYLGIIFAQRGAFAEGIAELDAAIKLDPTSSENRDTRAQIVRVMQRESSSQQP